MSRYERELKRVPAGFNDNADPSLVPQARCSLMIGVHPRSPGVLERSFFTRKVATLNAGVNTIDGLFPYASDSAANDRLLIVQNGTLYKAQVSVNQPAATLDAMNVSIGTLTAITNSSGITLPTGKRYRFAQHLNEVFLVCEGGLQPVRYNGTALYKCGITPPPAPTAGTQTAGPPNNLNGTYEYFATYADELGRESSPSASLVITLTNKLSVVINYTASADAQVQKIFLYRRVQGTTTLYRINGVGSANTSGSYTDNTPDASLSFNTIGPQPFQNEVPAPASRIAKYKNHLVLNSATDRTVAQISNLNGPTQFSLNGPTYAPNGTLLNPTDGLTLRILNEFGDEIVAFGQLGSTLAIWNRRTFGVFYGDNPVQFSYKPLLHIGCIAPDSIEDTGQGAIWLAEDGVQAIRYEDGFAPHKLSEDLDNQFRAATVLYSGPGAIFPNTPYGRTQRGANAVAWRMQGRYYLATPPWVYIYDLDNPGWSLDYMTYMPDSGGNLSNGYACACTMNVDRQYVVCFYSPGINSATAIGELWVGSYYPLQYGVGEGSFNYVYETRGVDGNGVHRTSLKQMKRTSVFGEVKAAPGSGSDPSITNPQTSGTILVDVDNGAYQESYPYDTINQIGTNFAGAGFARDQQQGKLTTQEWSPKVYGRLLKVRITGSAVGRLAIRDLLAEYIRLDGTG